MKQYLDLCQRIVDEGVWVVNERTGKRCLTVINADLEYDVGSGILPLVTTRKSYYKSAIAEAVGYLRGYDNAADFRDLGTKTWDANANLNFEWLKNPWRKGKDDMGKVYGAAARDWFSEDPDVGSVDTIQQVVDNLSAGIDTRGEIITFWNPGVFSKGCLRPCLHSHQFSILGDTLHMNSTQRSCDVPLGLNFNMVQCWVLLALMAKITGHKPGKVFHKIVNAHIYEDQLEFMKVQLKREPLDPPQLVLNDSIDLEMIMVGDIMNQFELVNYKYHDPIKYPFSV